MSYRDAKAYLRARPDDFILFGQYVLVLEAIQNDTRPPARQTPESVAKACKTTLRCEICKINTTCAEDMRVHLSGSRHHRALEQASPDDLRRAVARSLSKPADSLHACELCSRWFTDRRALAIHLRSNRHLLRQYCLLIRQAKLVDSNVNNISITRLPDPIPPLEPGGEAFYILTVTNNSSLVHELRRVHLLQPVDGVSVEDVCVPLPPRCCAYVSVRLAPRFLGLMRGLIVFDFGAFQAVRALSGSCTDAETEAAAAAARADAEASGRQRKRRTLEPVNTDIVPGEAPPGADSGGRVGGLELPVGFHPVPPSLRALVERRDKEGIKKRLGSAAAAAGSLQKYAARLKLLMWLEELQHEIDIRQYDMEGVTLAPASSSSKLLLLQVPGLAENRPSVLKGDRLYVKPHDGSSGQREWEGVVHVVEKEQVLLGFHRDFRHGGVWVSGRRFNVRFSVNRSMFNRLQAVLDRTAGAVLRPALLLPGSPAAPLPVPLPPGLPLSGPAADTFALTSASSASASASASLFGSAPARAPAPGGRIAWANGLLNEQQRLAVREVVRGAHHPLPYIIYGPPGTGKTSTLVEAGVQLLRADPGHSLLLVAPSNSAADQLFTRLLRAGRPLSEMMRVCAYTRPLADLPPVLDHLVGSAQINWDEGAGAFLLPSKERLTGRWLRVLVTTCATAAMLYHSGLPAGRFSHILVDEAGHAEEPLQLAALAGIAGPATRVVLAGDPQQLGPIVLSPFARRAGLEVSALERLTDLPPYARREGQQPPHLSTYITKLLLNYRSHPDILAVPNAAFYAGELRVAADPMLTHSLLHWEALPNRRTKTSPGCPILFHNMVGRDAQEQSSPSWHNVDEARQVKKYVESLLDMRQNRPTAEEIGIISPYRMQVQRIRALLGPLARSIKVGSVEEFQGQERKVIIVSTVRSSREHLPVDSKHRLGFLANPKRFNVAVTRAQALLIVVGNAQILATDRHWRKLLRFVRERGAATGQPLPADLGDDDDEDGGGGGGGDGGDGAVGQLAAALQGLALTAAGGAAAEAAAASAAALDAQLSYLGGALEVEGGEMRRLE